jgi:predicted NUDIX family NTP pyrophosphohydrolase
MPQQSAGILAYRFTKTALQVFLVHPGGPFWKNKNEGAWSIPKGELNEREDILLAAQREFTEETGIKLSGDFTPLQPVKQRSGKWVHAWAIAADFDAESIVSNTFLLPWPPKSGKTIVIPEVDRGEWMDISKAKLMINPGQAPLLDELVDLLSKSEEEVR